MVAPAAAAPVAGVYIVGAALLAGAAWLSTPAGRRASQTLGEAMYEGGAAAVDEVKDVGRAAMDVFTDEKDDTKAIPQTNTNDVTQRCDGPHRGRLQVQGYAPRVDSYPIELSWPWMRECIPPLRPEGLEAVSNLFLETQSVNYRSAGLRGKAFSAMSKHISSVSSDGFRAGYRKGFGITPEGKLRPNIVAGKNAPRVDLEVHAGRAFGDV
ncbi:hypothetical protein [Thalassospira sp.]|uniref:hypothetical protein n=1 Tax=Thalassospira sp. TaxID=1912094 RepID=UPI003AA8CBF0